MHPIRILRQWLGRLVHRPADLLEVFSGCGTLGVIGIALVNYSAGKSAPSVDLLSQAIEQPVLLAIVGFFAILQPWALHLDDPRDPRHPFVQPTKWLRTLAAGALLLWYLVLSWAVGISSGMSQTQAMYGMAAGMNLYVVAHVLFRARG